MVNNSKSTYYLIKYYFAEIGFDFQVTYAPFHLYFLKMCVIMKLLIMDVYFPLKIL